MSSRENLYPCAITDQHLTMDHRSDNPIVTFSHRLTVLAGVVDVRSEGTAGDGYGETPRRNEGYKTIIPTMSRSIARPH